MLTTYCQLKPHLRQGAVTSGGSTNPKGGMPTYYLAKFRRKLHGNEENWTNFTKYISHWLPLKCLRPSMYT